MFAKIAGVFLIIAGLAVILLGIAAGFGGAGIFTLIKLVCFGIIISTAGLRFAAGRS